MNPINTTIIETPRLTLVCCTKEILEALLDGNAAIANLLGVRVLPNWTINGEREYKWVQDRLLNGTPTHWLFYVAVQENTLIGSCGFKGAPDNGVVEIGYEVAPDHRCNGFATEMAKALIQFAFQYPEITKVQAHTLAVENESGSVLKKCGMKKMEALHDPDEGDVWRWELERL